MARSIPDRTAESEALVGRSVNRAAQLGISIGNALLDTAARVIPPHVSDLEAAIAVRRALFATVLSRPNAAARARAAAVLAHRAGEPREEARALRALALGLELSAAYDSSAVVLTTVERIERRVHDRATLAETLMRHGDSSTTAATSGRTRNTCSPRKPRRMRRTICTRSRLPISASRLSPSCSTIS